MAKGGPSLRVHLTTVFVILITVIVGSIAYFTYYRNTDAVLELADRFIRRTSASAIQRTESHLKPLAAAVRHLATLASDHPRTARDESIFPTLISFLDTYPQLQSIYFAFNDGGRFLQAFQLPAVVDRYGPNNSKMPDNVHYVLRTLDYGLAEPKDHWRYLDADQKVLMEEDAFRLFYDVRKRGWFKTVLQRPNTLYWTDVVVFTSSQLPGIAPAYPIHDKEGNAIGAAAANITLESLSAFLGKLDVGKNGVAFIMDANGGMVAHPNVNKILKQDGRKVKMARADDLADEWVADAATRYLKSGETKFVFNERGREFLASFTPFPADFEKDWVMAVIVPVDDFVGRLKITNRNILFLAILITILGMGLVSTYAGWVTRPVRKLESEIKRIQEFDLGGDLDVRAGTREILALAEAVKTMKAALQTFGRVVPKTLVREIVSTGQPVELGGQSRFLTIMFTDIQSFSAMAEREPTRQLMQHLSEHFQAITSAVNANQGTIDKFIGDSVMAFWGAPVWQEDHVYNGCLSALMAKRGLDELNAQWESEGGRRFHVRFGLHADAVLVGNVGAKERLSYSVLGDGVNVASRLEGVNKVYGTQICASHAVYKEAGERCLFRPLDMVAVQGRRGGIIVYELLATIGNGHPDYLADEQLRSFSEKSFDAFYAYQERRWDDAATLYREVQAIRPDDPVAAMFVERCRVLKADPPPADWSGVYALKSK